MYPEISSYTKLDIKNKLISPLSHLRLLNLIQEIEDTINNPDFNNIIIEDDIK